MNHKPKYLHIENPDGWRIRCSCRETTATHLTRQAAEDEYAKHMAEVEKTKARLARPMTLRATLDLYREKAADPNNSAAEREQWAALAHELAPRVPTNEPDPDQLGLF